MSDSRPIRRDVSSTDLAELAEICALAPDEEQTWLSALDTMDNNLDGIITAVEFDDFCISIAGETLFTESYQAPLASELRHRLFVEAQNLFCKTSSENLTLLTRRIEILEQAQEAVIAAEKEFHSGGLTEWLLSKSGTAWTQYGHAKEALTAILDKLRLALEEGYYTELPRELKIAEARLKGVKILWQSYIKNLDESAGAAAESSKDVVKAAVTAEIVLGAGVLTLPEIMAVGTTTAISASLSVSVFGHAAAATLLPPLFENTAKPTSKTESPIIETTLPDDEQKTDHLRTSAELVTQAQVALDQLKKTGVLNLDLGRFILEAHLAEDHAINTPFFGEIWQEFQKRRDDNFSLAKKLWSFTSGGEFTKKIDSVRRRLYADGSFTGYWGDQAQMNQGLSLDVLMNQTDAGGNCDFRNQTLVSYMTDAGFPRHDDWVPGVQILPGHIQPVLFNANTNEVWNLSAGEIKTGVDGTIYKPGIILWSYVAAKTNFTGAPSKDLIIAEPPLEIENALGSSKEQVQKLDPALLRPTNSIFSYPKARFDSGIELPSADSRPKFAFESYRDSDRASAEGAGGEIDLAATRAYGSQQGSQSSSQLLLLKPHVMTREQAIAALTKRKSDKSKNCIRGIVGCLVQSSEQAMLSLFEYNLSPYYFDTTYPQILVFANPHHALTYESLENDWQRLDYLKFLADNQLRQEIQSASGKKVLDAFLNPKNVAAFTGDDWQELDAVYTRLIQIYEKVSTEYNAVRTHMFDVPLQYKDEQERIADIEATAFPNLVSQMPALMNLTDAIQEFSDVIAANPKDTLTFLNTLPATQQHRWLRHSHHFGNNITSVNPWDPLLNLVADPVQVGFSEKNQTPPAATGWPKLDLGEFRPDKSVPITIVNEADIAELKNLGTGHFAIKTPKIETSQKKSKDQTSTINIAAKIIISSETMLEILIFDADTNWSGNFTLGRFTSEFSAEFKKLNAFGIHDAWFTGHFVRIIQRRLDPVFGSQILGLDPADPVHNLLVETSHFSQGYGAGALEHRTIPIPADLTKILIDIRARNPKEFSEMLATPAVTPVTVRSDGLQKGGGEFY